MKFNLMTAAAMMVFGSMALAQQGDYKAINPTDYTTVDCNATATRASMLKEYNSRYATGQVKVIDVLEQTKKSATKTSIACYGAYSFSDGSTKKILYKEMINSLGKTVWTFTPDS